MDRRKLLGVAGGLLPSLTGCFGSGLVASPENNSPTPPSACDDDLTRVTRQSENTLKVEEGPLGGFDLSLSKDSVPLDGQMMVQLRNVTDEEQMSGNKQKYLIERQTTDGWQSIYWVPEADGWTDEGKLHAPDEGYTWDLTVTQDGLTSREASPAYYVCEPLEPGTYRFVYWGITIEGESDGEVKRAQIGSKFTVTDG